MRIAVAGGTGMIGGALTRALRQRGDEVLVLTRGTPRQPGQLHWDPDNRRIHRGMLGEVDVFANFAGAPITRPWTPSYKEQIRSSRLRATDFIARLAAEQPGSILVNQSVSGIYGPGRDGEVLTEGSQPGKGFLPRLALDWEAATAPAREAGNRVVLPRTGVVLAREALTSFPLVWLGRLGVATRLGSGHQVWPWITLADEVSALIHLIDHDVHGPVNLAAPSVDTQLEISRAINATMRGTWITVPAPGALFQLVFGDFADEIIGSHNVDPHVLYSTGFTFLHPNRDAMASWLTASS